MAEKGFQIRGDKQNPYHLSIGLVVIKNDKVILLQKGSGDRLFNLKTERYTLPRETAYSQESITQVINRCAKEELGMSVEVKRSLGSLITHFQRSDTTQVEKTTVYFEVGVTGKVQSSPAVDAVDDKIVWELVSKAVSLLKSNKNNEYKIIERVIRSLG
ncbi:NUDIX domain-containing protein [Patescibacteria group bacterium]|nr:NUDIX domain-containing protein [Patescibacteria group bacterium]